MTVKKLNIKNVTLTLEAKRVKRVPAVTPDCRKRNLQRASSTSLTSTSSSTSTSVKSSSTRTSSWKEPYVPPPVIQRSTILVGGLILYGITLLWSTTILLLVTLVAAWGVPYCVRVNDEATTRRKLYREFVQHFSNDDDDETNDMPLDFRRCPEDIVLEEKYWANARGMCLYTYVMTPRNQPIKAIVCCCHGYVDQSSFLKRVEYQRLVRQGIAVVALDYEGHGLSDGPLGLIENWEWLIDDTTAFFNQTVQERFQNQPIFLMGESMGGAVAYCTYNRTPQTFRGVVLVSPMCKISDDMLPPAWVIRLLQRLVGPSPSSPSSSCSKSSWTSWWGYLPVAPSQHDVQDLSFHLPSKARIWYRPPTCFHRSPRLATARELLQVTSRISRHLSSWTAPFLVLHGQLDRITDPKLSVALYQESPSKDKSIRLYPDLWHAITSGETDESIDQVFHDVTEWILARC